MLADLDPPNVWIAQLDERLDDNTTVPFAMAVTYGGGPENWDCDNLEAFIGPSAGNASNATIDATAVARLSGLLDGSLASSAEASRQDRCNSTGVGDDEDDYDDSDSWDT